MKNMILAATALMFLTACDPFEGVLSVKESFVVKSTDKNADTVEKVTLPVGDLSAKFEFVSKTEMQIKTKINNKKKTLKLVFPKKLALPDNGDFVIAAADLGQDFGAAGKTTQALSVGPIQSGYESCTYQRRESYCYSDPKGHVTCSDRWVTVNGQRMSEFHDDTTHQTVYVSFVKDGKTLADLTGARDQVERVYRYQGQCF